MDAFSAATDAVFEDPNVATDGLWREGGTGSPSPVRVVLRRPDTIGSFGEARFVAATALLEVRVAEVAAPAAGDSIEIEGEVLVIQGEPVRDASRLVWRLEARPE